MSLCRRFTEFISTRSSRRRARFRRGHILSCSASLGSFASRAIFAARRGVAIMRDERWSHRLEGEGNRCQVFVGEEPGKRPAMRRRHRQAGERGRGNQRRSSLGNCGAAGENGKCDAMVGERKIELGGAAVLRGRGGEAREHPHAAPAGRRLLEENAIAPEGEGVRLVEEDLSRLSLFCAAARPDRSRAQKFRTGHCSQSGRRGRQTSAPNSMNAELCSRAARRGSKTAALRQR